MLLPLKTARTAVKAAKSLSTVERPNLAGFLMTAFDANMRNLNFLSVIYSTTRIHKEL